MTRLWKEIFYFSSCSKKQIFIRVGLAKRVIQPEHPPLISHALFTLNTAFRYQSIFTLVYDKKCHYMRKTIGDFYTRNNSNGVVYYHQNHRFQIITSIPCKTLQLSTFFFSYVRTYSKRQIFFSSNLAPNTSHVTYFLPQWQRKHDGGRKK